MADQTKISWCDATWNPWIGCSHVHTGCEHCYAEAQSGRHGVTWGLHGTRRKTSDGNWRKPAAWNRKAAVDGRQLRVMCGSLMDLFEPWGRPVFDHRGRALGRCTDDGTNTTLGAHTNVRPLCLSDLRRDVFGVFDASPDLTWIVPTKRPENVRGMWPCKECGRTMDSPCLYGSKTAYRPNVHLLYSASDQGTLQAGLPHLLACRDFVPVLGLSLEPLVGPVDLSRVLFGFDPVTFKHGPAGYCDRPTKPDWVIVGGESGPDARPCDVEWIRSIVRQCEAAGVACFVKQMGARPVDHGTGLDWPVGVRMQWDPDHGNGARIVLRHPAGADPAEWPEDLRVQQYPEASE